MKRPDVFTELEAAAVGCIALEGDASSNLTRLLRVGVAIAAPSAADTAVGMKRS